MSAAMPTSRQVFQLIATTVDDVTIEAHKPPNFVGRALPVFGGKRIGAQIGDTHLDGALDNIEESILATCVTLSAPKTALPGPTSVAVHDDGDVLGDEFRWQLGWTSSRRMRQRAALRGSRCDSGHGSQRSGVEDGSGAGLVPS